MADNTTTYSREQLKRWFKNGCKPTENHFAAHFDSYFHKDDLIPVSSIENLEELLQQLSGLTREEVEEMIAQHNSAPDAHDIGTLTDFTSAFAPTAG